MIEGRRKEEENETKDNIPNWRFFEKWKIKANGEKELLFGGEVKILECFETKIGKGKKKRSRWKVGKREIGEK